MKVPPATLNPTDSLAYIFSFGRDGCDLLELTFHIERELHVKIPAKIFRKPHKGEPAPVFTSLRDLVAFLAKHRSSFGPWPESSQRGTP